MARGRARAGGELAAGVPPGSPPLRGVPRRAGHHRSGDDRRAHGARVRRAPRGAAGRRRPAAVRAGVDRPLAGGGALVPPVLRAGGLPADRSERRGRRATRAAGDPEGARRGAGHAAARCGRRATRRARNAIGRCSSCSTRPASGSARRSGSTSTTSISKTDSCACSARATRNGSCPSAAPRAPRSVAYLREGRLALRNARLAPRRRHRCGVPQRARDASLTAGVLDDRARRGRAGRPAGAAVAARPAALVRDAHARSRCRPPRRAGAARPRHDLDHAGVHEGLAGTAPRRVRSRPPARLRRGAPLGGSAPAEPGPGAGPSLGPEGREPGVLSLSCPARRTPRCAPTW